MPEKERDTKPAKACNQAMEARGSPALRAEEP